MSMHKSGKWAKQIIELQHSDGSWGYFHTQCYGDRSMTTEQALRRLERLGFTIEDECIQRAVAYMSDCLSGRRELPDRREKIHNWDIFTSLMLSTWIRRFTGGDAVANSAAAQWSEIITAAFAGGAYDDGAYKAAYTRVFGQKPAGGRLIDFANFYVVSLMSDCLDERTCHRAVSYLLNHDSGIYYIYPSRIADLPAQFESRATSGYLAAAELLARYRQAKDSLAFIADWLNDNRSANGGWDMGKGANDKVYLPLSDDWRSRERREADCTERICALLKALS